MSLRDQQFRRFMQTTLRAYVFPTYKGDPDAMRLIIQDGYRVYHKEFRTTADTMGVLDSKVEADLKRLGFVPVGNEKYDVPDKWINRDGGFVRLLRKDQPT